MAKVNGSFIELDGEEFYKIENYDCMNDFFMTITSSSDVWNFLWAHGGISAGRKNSDQALFPYMTCDRIRDVKNTTGPLTIIKIFKDGKLGKIWQPFESLLSSSCSRHEKNIHIKRNLYKNLNGSKIIFEEVNAMEGLCFRYGWTSSKKFGLVKTVYIKNFSGHNIKLEVLDGCRNILSSCISSQMENTKSVLLDAYKKNEVDEEGNIALFSLSSVVTDKAEPSECLLTNVSWFTTLDKVIISDNAVKDFIQENGIFYPDESLGKRGECYILHKSSLESGQAECWEQVLDVNLDVCKLEELKSLIKDRKFAWKILENDIKKTDAELESLIQDADGLQECGDFMTSVHHRTNVMFNIMRGGIFYDNGKIHTDDFMDFVSVRNFSYAKKLKSLFKSNEVLSYDEFYNRINSIQNNELLRLALEYLPLCFSRRHGDPSRPWNKFDIVLEKENKPVMNYEGNWRDIFQNWEALVWSYPEYVKNFVSVFLNNMTCDGFNPYRISRSGPDWEVPEKDNPWSQYGYWTDHQLIYLQNFLEFYSDYDRDDLKALFLKNIFTTVNVPYRIKSYSEILKDPRHSINFDYELNKKIHLMEKEIGSDARLLLDNNNEPLLFSLSTKLLQIILAKALNHIPAAGIWMNMQRPEWNDANNALAGYGASVVTLCHLYRSLTFLIELYSDIKKEVPVDRRVYITLEKTAELYENYGSNAITDSYGRKDFCDRAGILFEEERNSFYVNEKNIDLLIPAERISELLKKINQLVMESIVFNKRKDNLYHSYNTIRICDDRIEIVNLKLMLEGQVAILASGLLNKNDVLDLCSALRVSPLYEKHQQSYLLYPNSSLKKFGQKNCLTKNDIKDVLKYVEKNPDIILKKDCNGNYHFDSSLKNNSCLEEKMDSLTDQCRPDQMTRKAFLDLYEKTFNHKLFTGRSGSFYGYEGLGCIYWHQVAKLLQAVQENYIKYPELKDYYEDIKKGLACAKSPDLYGAFPFDPYSHTPYMEGARQPGMTGQVKEEIITRFKELGISIKDSKVVFDLSQLGKNELNCEKIAKFTYCGTKICYFKAKLRQISVYFNSNLCENISGNTLSKKISRQLFSRSGEIDHIEVYSDFAKL
ncbi:hypothetical protein [Treponema sp.]|uniref:hypothetical protein n=1 Tax=Treponema sp. TaxID=166 RepID=UPI0025F81B03|nr:hypothetical protein [Treponema sp.]MCR5218290.1 hypothetical protein [Treponema sp.]